MNRAKHERLRLRLSGLEAARRAKLAPGTLSQIESGRFIPYEVQLARLAEALEWTGDPAELLEDVQAS